MQAAPRLKPVALAILGLALASAVEAQSTQRIEITGSSIKRLETETALPVQTVTREEIEKSGVTTAAELMTKISANSNGLTDGASITDGTSGQRGFNSANLRGIGASSTLVLLNGRRLANFASPGDSAGVDLNNIPAAAIQRVEILKDGASAVYGTDAIGGVINFITRRDYTGTDLKLYGLATQDGGADKFSASVSAGFGELERDGFNVFAAMDVQQLGALRSGQRDFIARNDIPNRLGNLLSSFPVPANFDISTAQRNQLNTAGGYGFTRNRINFTRPGCNPPASVNAPSGPGGRDGCTYNYMEDTEIYPDSQKIGFLGRATLRLGADHHAFVELLRSQTSTRYVLSPVPLRLRNTGGVDDRVSGSVVPQFAAAGITGPISSVRLRTTEMGNRTNEVDSDATRIVAGLTGTLAGWDYDAAINHSVNEAVDHYVDGYFRYRQIADGIKSGAISLTGTSGAAGKAIIEAARVNDAARASKGTMDSVDVKASRPLMTLPGGELALALGAEARREKAMFTPSELLRSNDIGGDRDSSNSSPPLEPSSHSRNVRAVFAEVSAPFAKGLEAQFAVRHDRYAGVGNTTNPKVGLRWEPSQQMLLRGSYGTGFRAPSFSELFRQTIFGTTSSVLPDPVLCEVEGGDLSFCADQWPVERRSNPNLKPEKSRQFALGAVFEPSREWSFSADWWSIRKTDVISDIGEEVILANVQRYENTFASDGVTPIVSRDEDGFITNIVLEKRNQGVQRTHGIDISAEWRGVKTDLGRFAARLNGTLVLKSEKQTAPGEAFVSNLGKFVNDGVVQRWRHRLFLDWDSGPWGATLSNTYYAKYTDQNTAINLDTGEQVAPNKVKAYSLWDLAFSYDVSKSTRLRGGIQNLFNTMPPFSNQAYYFLASYDPTYTDPRGRSFYASISHSFK